jgi:hypothetical protein
MIERYLERLFTWESLENTERGVEFELKNRLVETEFTGLTTVRIDGNDVPLEDVTLVLGDGTEVLPEEVSEESPLVFELADTMQVISDIDRLTLGEHEVSMGFEVEDYGRVSFTTDDEVTEDDLVGTDVLEIDAEKAVALVERIREPVTLRRILDEESTEERDRVVEATEERLKEVRHVEERRELVDEGTRIDERIEEFLEEAFEGRRRLLAYAALRSIDGGNAEEVAREIGVAKDTVENVLQEMEMDGTVEYDYETGGYEAVPPSKIAVEHASGFVGALKNAVDGLG